MSTKLTKTMTEAIEFMRAHGGSLIRLPGGFWCVQGIEQPWQARRPCRLLSRVVRRPTRNGSKRNIAASRFAANCRANELERRESLVMSDMDLAGRVREAILMQLSGRFSSSHEVWAARDALLATVAYEFAALAAKDRALAVLQDEHRTMLAEKDREIQRLMANLDRACDAIAEADHAARHAAAEAKRELLARVAKLPSPWDCVTAGANPIPEGGMSLPMWHCHCRWCESRATVRQWKYPVIEGHPANGCLWSDAQKAARGDAAGEGEQS